MTLTFVFCTTLYMVYVKFKKKSYKVSKQKTHSEIDEQTSCKRILQRTDSGELRLRRTALR